MSRSRKALITAAFSYAQTALGVALSVFVTRYLIHRLGPPLYGLWLASGALLAYAALADLGIFGVMPWLVAEADGRRDVPGIRSLLLHGCVAGVAVGSGYVVVALVLWTAFPSVLHISVADRAQLFGPLALMVGATFISYPLRVFTALHAGLQDAVFSGAMSLCQLVLSNALIVLLTWKGYGLFGVAAGAAIPPVVIGLGALVRAIARRRELLREWPRLDLRAARPIMSGGVGAWLGSMGWQLAFSSDSIVIGYLGRLDLVPTFAVTSRIGQMLMQLGWALPDSALVGLAQLNAEGQKARVRSVVTTLLRFHLLTAGGVACVVLAANPGFVRLWLGESMFGGHVLNAIFAADIVMLSFVHGLMTCVAVLGNRTKVGAVTLVNGALHGILAIPFGMAWGLSGVALATFVSALLTTMPAGLRWIEAATGVTPRELLGGLLAKWGLRAVPLFAIAALIGRQTAQRGVVVVGASAVLVGAAYLVVNRPLLRDLPFPGRAKRLLARLRLI